jgi:hypothetical protein
LALFVVLAFGATACANPPSAKAKVRDSKEVKTPGGKAIEGISRDLGRKPVPQFEPCYRFMWRYR